ISSLDVSVAVNAAGDATKAAALLRRLLQPAAAEKKTARALSYPGAASVRVQLAASGSKPVVVELPRTEGPRAGPAPSRPGSDTKEKITLANLYTTDGLLGDSDN